MVLFYNHNQFSGLPECGKIKRWNPAKLPNDVGIWYSRRYEEASSAGASGIRGEDV
jgi:hypothetical protein